MPETATRYSPERCQIGKDHLVDIRTVVVGLVRILRLVTRPLGQLDTALADGLPGPGLHHLERQALGIGQWPTAAEPARQKRNLDRVVRTEAEMIDMDQPRCGAGAGRRRTTVSAAWRT